METEPEVKLFTFLRKCWSCCWYIQWFPTWKWRVCRYASVFHCCCILWWSIYISCGLVRGCQWSPSIFQWWHIGTFAISVFWHRSWLGWEHGIHSHHWSAPMSLLWHFGPDSKMYLFSIAYPLYNRDWKIGLTYWIRQWGLRFKSRINHWLIPSALL